MKKLLAIMLIALTVCTMVFAQSAAEKSDKVQLRVLNYIDMSEPNSANEIALNLGYSQRQVERTIAALKRDGHLIRMGSNKNGYWEIKED